MPNAGEKWRHYKGGEYVVVARARHSETEEELVVYQSTADETKTWVRPLAMWLETVEWEGERVPRFSLI